MKHFEGEKKIVDIVCDICKKSTRKEGYHDFEFAELKANWGYDSNKDLESHSCDMCESCYDKVRVFILSIGGAVECSCYGGIGSCINMPDFDSDSD